MKVWFGLGATVNTSFFLIGKVPPVEITVTSDLNVSKHHIVPAAEPSRLYMWLTVGVLFGLLLLGAVFPFAVCVLRSHYTKLR